MNLPCDTADTSSSDQQSSDSTPGNATIAPLSFTSWSSIGSPNPSLLASSLGTQTAGFGSTPPLGWQSLTSISAGPRLGIGQPISSEKLAVSSFSDPNSMKANFGSFGVASGSGEDTDPTDQTTSTSTGKRVRKLLSNDSMVEDILGQICQKMNKLSTGMTETQVREDKVAAFIQVLQCTREEATFYLDSAAWDIETAVVLVLDMFGTQREGTTATSNAKAWATKQTWRPIQVFIKGLDPAWAARVSRRTGQIYFLHLESGHTQSHVPDGFADDNLERERQAQEQENYNGGDWDDDEKAEEDVVDLSQCDEMGQEQPADVVGMLESLGEDPLDAEDL